MENLNLTCNDFKKRMVDLCLRSGMTEFPTKHGDQLVLLKSIAIDFTADKDYTEADVNSKIKQWLARMDCFPGWDHITLRRRLVDEEFLTRNQDGSCYRLTPGGPSGITFDPAIDALDIFEVLEEGQKLIAQKKTQYLQRQAKSL